MANIHYSNSGGVGPQGPVGAKGDQGPTGPSGVSEVSYTTYDPNWTATGLTYSGTPALGYYAVVGKLIHFHIQVNLSSVSNFGTGQYFMDLPFAPLGDYAFRDGGLHVLGNHYPLMADAEAGSVSMDLWYTGANGQDLAFTKTSPHALTTSNKFYINGTYLIP